MQSKQSAAGGRRRRRRELKKTKRRRTGRERNGWDKKWQERKRIIISGLTVVHSFSICVWLWNVHWSSEDSQSCSSPALSSLSLSRSIDHKVSFLPLSCPVDYSHLHTPPPQFLLPFPHHFSCSFAFSPFSNQPHSLAIILLLTGRISASHLLIFPSVSANHSV